MRRALILALAVAAPPAFALDVGEITAPTEMTGPEMTQAGGSQPALIDRQGSEVGRAWLEEKDGLTLKVLATGLGNGARAMHLHAVGKCDPADGFASAGPHLAAPGQMHGHKHPQGPHAGDLPDIVSQEGNASFVSHALQGVALEVTSAAAPVAIRDADGTALIIHARPDDQITQPSGGAGDRHFCAVLATPKE